MPKNLLFPWWRRTNRRIWKQKKISFQTCNWRVIEKWSNELTNVMKLQQKNTIREWMYFKYLKLEAVVEWNNIESWELQFKAIYFIVNHAMDSPTIKLSHSIRNRHDFVYWIIYATNYAYCMCIFYFCRICRFFQQYRATEKQFTIQNPKNKIIPLQYSFELNTGTKATRSGIKCSVLLINLWFDEYSVLDSQSSSVL